MQLRRFTHRQQCAVSLGAAITLVAGCGEYHAEFECANRCAEVLGDRMMEDRGDGIFEVIPHYKIPTEDLNAALIKLSKQFSVALVEWSFSEERFILLWKIERESQPEQLTVVSLDDY